MKTLWRKLALTGLGLATLFNPSVVSAQTTANPPPVKFNSFTGIYHLSRDSNGVSLLTTEETVLAEFSQGTGFYGITREIPKSYRGETVDVKVLNVVDAAGNQIPYKISSSGSNLALTTGDPDIKLYGSQTFKINYQTTGVVNLSGPSDEFLLNVNGRGWSQPFQIVNATVHIPDSFRASLQGDPSCYLALNSQVSDACQIATQKASQETIITSKATNLLAHQALVVKMDFKPSTFTDKKPSIARNLVLGGLALATTTSIFYYAFLRKKTR